MECLWSKHRTCHDQNVSYTIHGELLITLIVEIIDRIWVKQQSQKSHLGWLEKIRQWYIYALQRKKYTVLPYLTFSVVALSRVVLFSIVYNELKMTELSRNLRSQVINHCSVSHGYLVITRQFLTSFIIFSLHSWFSASSLGNFWHPITITLKKSPVATWANKLAFIVSQMV